MKDDQPELHPRCKSKEEVEEVQPRLENQVIVVQLRLELGTHLVGGWGCAGQDGLDEGSSDDEKCGHIVNSTMLYLSPRDVDIRSTCPAFPAEDDGLLLMSPLSPCDNHHHHHCC